ncbi:MAG: potassium channel family protein [Planctomycetota bacterium]
MLRRRVHRLLEVAADGDRLSRAVDLGLVLLILANVTAVVLDSVPRIHARYGDAFGAFETFSLVVFGLEYALRLWSCPENPRFADPVRGRLRCARQPMMLIDLLSVLPGLLTMQALDLRMLRAVRLLRLLRLLKLTRYSSSLQTFGRILRSKAPELVSTLVVMLLLLVMASSLMFVLENDANPAFDSIPTAMWWGIATFTTVGYGDITPITPAGRLLGGMVAILGIAMFAIPAGVLGAAFVEEQQRRRGRRDDRT